MVRAGRAELAPDAGPPESVRGLLDKYAQLLEAINMTAEEFTGSYTVPVRVLVGSAGAVCENVQKSSRNCRYSHNA